MSASRFAPAVRELRFLLSQSGPESSTLRSFLTKTYPTLKKWNPDTPILIREAAGVSPKIYARYEFGKEKSEQLEGLSESDIVARIDSLTKNPPS